MVGTLELREPFICNEFQQEEEKARRADDEHEEPFIVGQQHP